MIQVIKGGKFPIVRFVCPACRCEFLADHVDYKVEASTGYANGLTPFAFNRTFHAKCPFCEKRVQSTEVMEETE